MEMIENKKLVALLDEVFSAENQKGHLKWKISEIARSCNVSKSLVYYHLGKNKLEVLDSCIEIIASEFWGLNPTREKMVKTGNLFDSLMYTRKMFEKTPSFTVFYTRWRLTKTEIGKKLADFDKRYQKKLAGIFPHFTPTERVALQAVFHGLVTAPVLDEEAMKTALKWLPLSPKAN